MQVYDKEMDLKRRKALVELDLQDVQILLMLKCVQLWAQRPQRKILTMNNMINQVLVMYFYFLFLGESWVG